MDIFINYTINLYLLFENITTMMLFLLQIKKSKIEKNRVFLQLS